MTLVTPGLYRALTALGGPAITGLLAWRRAHGKEERERLSERFGIPSRPRPPGPLLWLHASSVGEAQSSLPLIDRLMASRPGLEILVTTGTVTSARLMAERLPGKAIHQYQPVDRLPWVRRFLDHWRPDVALWIESELWPNLVLETARRRIPMALVNARMSDRSWAGWRRLPGIIRPLLAAFRRVLAQSEADAARFRSLGAADLVVTGSLKYAAAALPADPAELSQLGRAIGDRPRWLAASTHPGEEAIAADVHRRLKQRHPGLLTLLAPRHPRRGAAIAAALEKAGLTVARRSRGDAPTTEVYLADTMGELGLLFRLAPIVFMGGSLVPHGGQNLLEPARAGCAILHGPHVHNFRAIAADLAAAGASQEVRDAGELAAAVDTLLADAALAQRRCAAARRAGEDGRGVLDAAIAALAPLLDGLGGPPIESGVGAGVART